MKLPNLKDMFALQAKTDSIIRETQKVDYDTVDLKVIAFKVEFGEFLNEHKFFKFWKVDRTPNTVKAYPKFAPVTGDPLNNYLSYRYENPLTDELADCMAFLLGIALEKKWDKFIHALHVYEPEAKTMTTLALGIFNNSLNSSGKWLDAMYNLIDLADRMGISAGEIEAAYIKKNQINLDRQATRY